MSDDYARLALHDVSGLLQDLLKKLDGEQALVWADGLKRFLRKEDYWSRVLHFNEQVQLPARSTLFTPADYFKSRDGLHVGDAFPERVLSATTSVEQVPGTSIASFNLIKETADEGVRAKLHPDHVFQDVSVFCAYLAHLLDGQPGGTVGSLAANTRNNNFYYNVFYVQVGEKVLKVYARWIKGGHQWDVNAWELSGTCWSDGSRFFSATAHIPLSN